MGYVCMSNSIMRAAAILATCSITSRNIKTLLVQDGVKNKFMRYHSSPKSHAILC